jgi:hypothetical protein
MVKPNRKTRNSRLNKRQQKWIDPPRNEQFVRIFLDEMDGESWRGLSISARRMYEALIRQHYEHFQGSNGELEISYGWFKRAGITNRNRVLSARRELVAAGKIKVTRGIGHNSPTFYELPSCRKRRPKDAPFVWVPLKVMGSPAWCGLSLSAKRIMDRLLIENYRHHRMNNGRLRVSYEQFRGHGVALCCIATALRKLVKAGLLAITKGAREDERQGPNLYRLTFLGTIDGPATWRESNVVLVPKKPRFKTWKEKALDEFRKVVSQ